MSNYNYEFGKRFQYFRKRAGLTQEEAAKKLGYSTHSSIFKIENGRQDVPITMIPQICQTFQCDPLELLGVKDGAKFSAPEGSMLMERIDKLPAAQRNKLLDTVEILVKGLEDKE